MGSSVGLMINTFTLNEERFWRIAEWCLLHGASDFYILTPTTTDEDETTGRGEILRQFLLCFRKTTERRWVPSYCLWTTEEMVDLYHLSNESLVELRKADLGKLFVTRDEAIESSPGLSRFVYSRKEIQFHHLCLYREGKPMLAIFEEQFPELLVVLRKEELSLFKEQDFGVQFTVVGDYYIEYFG